MKALTDPASSIANRSRPSPVPSAKVTRRSSNSPKRAPPYRLAATTARSTSGGIAVRSKTMRSSLPSPWEPCPGAAHCRRRQPRCCRSRSRRRCAPSLAAQEQDGHVRIALAGRTGPSQAHDHRADAVTQRRQGDVGPLDHFVHRTPKHLRSSADSLARPPCRAVTHSTLSARRHSNAWWGQSGAKRTRRLEGNGTRPTGGRSAASCYDATGVVGPTSSVRTSSIVTKPRTEPVSPVTAARWLSSVRRAVRVSSRGCRCGRG